MDRQPAYDVMGVGYATTRREDPRIARAIWDALGDATSVANIGAGTGNYEPRDRDVIAIEPSDDHDRAARRPARHRRSQGIGRGRSRWPTRASTLRGGDHSRSPLARSGDSPRRDAVGSRARRVVALTFDERPRERFWLTRDYLHRVRIAAERTGTGVRRDSRVCRASSRVRPDAVPLPRGCSVRGNPIGDLLRAGRIPASLGSGLVHGGIEELHHRERTP